MELKDLDTKQLLKMHETLLEAEPTSGLTTEDYAEIKKRMSTPPRPGLVFDETKHRWVRPEELHTPESPDKKKVYDAIDEIEKLGVRNPIDERMVVIGDVALFPFQFDNKLYFDIMTFGEQGKGSASKVLDAVINIADKYGVTIAGTVEPFGVKRGLDKNQLKAWYKRHGFDVHWDSVRREPQKPKESQKIETVKIPMFTNARGETLGEQEAPRYVFHMPRVKSKSGIKAYDIREKKAASSFGSGHEKEKYVWISQEPMSTEGTVVIDLTKVDSKNLRYTGQAEGHLLHRGDIPESAIIRNPKINFRPEGGAGGRTPYVYEPEVKKYETLTDRPPKNPVEPGKKPPYLGGVVEKAIETTSLVQQMLIRKVLPRANPKEEEHRHVGYDEPHPVDQEHWGEDASDVSIEGPFSVSSFLGKHPRDIVGNYTGAHEAYYKMLQTYLDLANPSKDVTDNQLKIVATNLRPRVMKCADDIRRVYLAYDRELRDIGEIGAQGKDSEELELKKADAGRVFEVLNDVSEDLDNPEDRVQIAMALDRLISLEESKPSSWYLTELFGIKDSEPIRETTLRVIEGLSGQNKLEKGFVGVHHIITGLYLLKGATLVTGDLALYEGVRDRAFVIEKQSNKPVIIAGYASPVVKDKEGHRIPLFALKKAFAKFMQEPKFRNAMIKHRNAQVGEVIPEYVDAEGRKWQSQVDDIGLFVVIKLRDDIKIARDVADLIRKGILRSFSIGGEALARKYICQSDQCWWDVVDLELHEITICEEGKNQAAKFILLKSENIEADLNKLDTTDLYSSLKS